MLDAGLMGVDAEDAIAIDGQETRERRAVAAADVEDLEILLTLAAHAVEGFPHEACFLGMAEDVLAGAAPSLRIPRRLLGANYQPWEES